jgi:hypothetical protein
MAELCESSGLHSLAALREHEKRRVQQQAEAARARAEAEQCARKEAERAAARSEQEQRLAKLAHAEATQRAELLQLETAQRAELERAEGLLRASAELKLQLQREREARRSTELGLTSQLLRQRLWASTSAALCVGSWLAAAGLYFFALRPSTERALEASRQSLLGESRARLEGQQGEAHSLRRAQELSSRVSSLEQELRAERDSPAPLPAVIGRGRRWTTREPVSVAPLKPCRDDGDPLNPCLKR